MNGCDPDRPRDNTPWPVFVRAVFRAFYPRAPMAPDIDVLFKDRVNDRLGGLESTECQPDAYNVEKCLSSLFEGIRRDVRDNVHPSDTRVYEQDEEEEKQADLTPAQSVVP